jgi:tetratricopeptide (TPR) repeat protein
VDIEAFDTLVRSASSRAGADGRSASSRAGAEAARLLREALGLWHGEPLADATGAFVEAARTTLIERRLGAVEQLATVELDLDRAPTVVTDLLPLVAAHPYRESLRRLLMLALHRCGRQAEALESFRAYRELLADQQGLDPGAGISRLAVEILQAGPDRLTPTPSPPVAPRQPVPAQLPADVAGFVGRRDHLDELSDIAGSGSGSGDRVVVVSGMGGIGKSALVVHWAHEVANRFPDGQLFLDLHGFAPDAAVPPLVALARCLRALGEPAGAIPTDLDEAAALYRTRLADRRMLVVLDNARDADQVRPLLPGGGGAFTVVTSRDWLTGLVARDGARPLTLDALTPDESGQLLTRLLPPASRAEPGLPGDLATACGHVPLAMRMVAARLAAAEVPVTAELLHGGTAAELLTLMQVEGDRLASVRAAFDLSYAALPEPAQRLFRRLGQVPGPDASAALAGAVAGLPDPEPYLDRLVESSLLRPVGADRYGLHDLVRLYATVLSEQDIQDERAATVERMYRWYLDRIEAAATALYPQTLRLPSAAATSEAFADDTDALSWLDAELPGLVAAVTSPVPHRPPGAVARVADGLRGYFWIRRYMPEWMAIAAAGIDAAAGEGDEAGLAANHISLGLAYRSQSRYDESVGELNRALALARRVPWPEAEATALSQLAVAHAEMGRLALARDSMVEALAVNRRLGRTGSEAVVLGNLGSLRIRAGELTQAARDLTEAMALYQQVGSSGGEAIARSNLGVVRAYQGDFADAAQHLTAALAQQREIGDRYGQTVSLTTLALLNRERGRYAEATGQATEALAITRETGDRQGEAYALITLGQIRSGLGAHSEAAAFLRDGADLAHADNDRLPETEALIGLAQAHLDLGSVDAAFEVAERVVRQADELSFTLLGGQALTVLAAVHLAAGRLTEARTCADQAQKRHVETGHRPGQARTHWVSGRIWRAAGDEAAAVSELAAAEALFMEMGMPLPGQNGQPIPNELA